MYCKLGWPRQLNFTLTKFQKYKILVMMLNFLFTFSRLIFIDNDRKNYGSYL